MLVVSPLCFEIVLDYVMRSVDQQLLGVRWRFHGGRLCGLDFDDDVQKRTSEPGLTMKRSTDDTCAA